MIGQGIRMRGVNWLDGRTDGRMIMMVVMGLVMRIIVLAWPEKIGREEGV